MSTGNNSQIIRVLNEEEINAVSGGASKEGSSYQNGFDIGEVAGEIIGIAHQIVESIG